MKKKFLVTGISGFVGRHFVQWLEDHQIQSEVMGLDHAGSGTEGSYVYVNESFRQIDLLSKTDIEHVLAIFQPDYVLHLAACSSVAVSWKEPVVSFNNNMNVFLNLVESIRQLDLACRILSVGSSEVYGNINKDHLPLTEDSPMDPVSPYAVARVSQELLSRVYSDSYGVDIVMTRSFNHIGPGQREQFVVSAFAKQIVEIKQSGVEKGLIRTGDLDIIRDFVDVRDVVRAYYRLLMEGVSGQVYNICSGTGRSLRELVGELSSEAGVMIRTEVNPDFIRPSDNREIVGSSMKIHEELDWKPEISLNESLRDILRYWENECRS